jgi:hypothetical protein
MNFKQAQEDIQQWLVDFVERPNAKLSGWPPCPFARQARLQQRIDIRRGLDPFADLLTLANITHDVVMFVYDPEQWDSDSFAFMIDSSNRGFLHSRNLIALGDHPRDIEIINGVTMNQGTYAITFVQSLDKLNEHAQQLASKGYYNNWPEFYLEDLFRYRQDPRS